MANKRAAEIGRSHSGGSRAASPATTRSEASSSMLSQLLRIEPCLIRPSPCQVARPRRRKKCPRARLTSNSSTSATRQMQKRREHEGRSEVTSLGNSIRRSKSFSKNAERRVIKAHLPSLSHHRLYSVRMQKPIRPRDLPPLSYPPAQVLVCHSQAAQKLRRHRRHQQRRLLIRQNIGLTLPSSIPKSGILTFQGWWYANCTVQHTLIEYIR